MRKKIITVTIVLAILQKQIEMVRKACEYAEKALAENRKLYSLGSRQVPAITPPLDKAQAAKIAEQEKLLRAGVNMGEGVPNFILHSF